MTNMHRNRSILTFLLWLSVIAIISGCNPTPEDIARAEWQAIIKYAEQKENCFSCDEVRSRGKAMRAQLLKSRKTYPDVGVEPSEVKTRMAQAYENYFNAHRKAALTTEDTQSANEHALKAFDGLIRGLQFLCGEGHYEDALFPGQSLREISPRVARVLLYSDFLPSFDCSSPSHQYRIERSVIVNGFEYDTILDLYIVSAETPENLGWLPKLIIRFSRTINKNHYSFRMVDYGLKGIARPDYVGITGKDFPDRFEPNLDYYWPLSGIKDPQAVYEAVLDKVIASRQTGGVR
jgi:hypothetical protein